MIKEYLIKREHSYGSPKPLLYAVDGNGCWNNVSHAKDRDGYGKITFKNKTLKIHRLVYELENNISLKPEEVVRHKCDNPCCFNPEHLEIGSSQENTKDRDERGRSAKGEKNGNSKVSDKEVVEIFYSSGTQVEISKRFNVSVSLVSLIKRKKLHTELLEGLNNEK